MAGGKEAETSVAVSGQMALRRPLPGWAHWSLPWHSLLPPASCAHPGPLPRMASMPYLCLAKSCPSVILAPCHLHAECSDFFALSAVPLPEALALPCLQLPLELSTSVPWGGWVSVAVGSSSRLRPSHDSALCP